MGLCIGLSCTGLIMYRATCKAMHEAMYRAKCTKGSFGRQSTTGLVVLLYPSDTRLSGAISDRLEPVTRSMGLILRLISRLLFFALSLSAEAGCEDIMCMCMDMYRATCRAMHRAMYRAMCRAMHRAMHRAMFRVMYRAM